LTCFGSRLHPEERDSVRLLAGCYAALCAKEGAATPVKGTDARVERIERVLERLAAEINWRDPSRVFAPTCGGHKGPVRAVQPPCRTRAFDPGTPTRPVHP